MASAFRALEGLGYLPIVPVEASDFANIEIREKWIREKVMIVLSFHSETHREMKLAADRPRDHDDVQHLQWIIEENEKKRD